ncbi:MAG: hypothetical protein ACP5DC_03440 [Halothiobacillaceae bacterium]
MRLLAILRRRRAEATLLVAALALLVLVSPLRQVWLGPAAPWFAPYLAWGGVILLLALIASRGSDRAD